MIRKIFTLHTARIAIEEAYANKLTLISIAQAKASQSNAGFFKPAPGEQNTDPLQFKKKP